MLDRVSYFEYIKADVEARGQTLSLYYFFTDSITRFHWYLRTLELLQKKLLLSPLYIILKFLFLRLSQRLGFSVPINTIGKGVYFPHYGTIVINSKAKIGDYSVINVDVVVGRHPESKLHVPKIGKSVYIAPGVKLFGDIEIGDNCIIGANSVVTKSMPVRKVIVGVPGVIVSSVTNKMIVDYGFKVKE